MLTGVIICSNMKHLIWVPKLRNRVSMQKHWSFLDYKYPSINFLCTPTQREHKAVLLTVPLLPKAHAPDITLFFLTNKMKLASSGNTLTATTSTNFCYWFLPCQDSMPLIHGRETWKISGVFSTTGKSARLCWYIHINSGSKCKRD